MKVIVGLGNPGDRFVCTRHNVGFSIVDSFLSKQNIPLKTYKSTHKAHIYSLNQHIICKPQTYMNLSGDSLLSIKKSYFLENSSFLVIYDDLYLPTGKFRYSTNKSSGGHNGIKDIILKLEGKDFISLRVGIGPRERANSISDYVMDYLTPEDILAIKSITPTILDSIEDFISGIPLQQLQMKYAYTRDPIDTQEPKDKDIDYSRTLKEEE